MDIKSLPNSYSKPFLLPYNKYLVTQVKSLITYAKDEFSARQNALSHSSMWDTEDITVENLGPKER